jgi:hypothetical protein
LPSRWPVAPVKEPFSWPKSSLSIRLSGMAAQLTAMNGAARCECFQMERAMSSLPVPLSPVIITVTSLAVTWPMILNTSCMTGAEEPTMPSR